MTSDVIKRYPKIKGFSKLAKESILCQLKEKGCGKTLLSNRQHVELILTKYSAMVNAYLALSQRHNFTHLSRQKAQMHLPTMLMIHQLVTYRIFYLIEDGEDKRATIELAQLIGLTRAMSANNENIEPFVVLAIMSRSSIEPLLVKLLALSSASSTPRDYTVLLEALAPLSSKELSLNRFYTSLFIESVRNISKAKEMVDKDERLLFSSLSDVFLKENMTYNVLFNEAKTYIIGEPIVKELLIDKLERAAITKKAFNELHLADTKTPYYWYLVKNYNNIIGATLTMSGPSGIDFYKDLVSLDLEFSLYRLMLASPQKSVNTLLEQNRFDNPYTGEKPKVFNHKICYEMEEAVCIVLPVERIKYEG